MDGTRVVLYGDFNCPWSYLASRRAELLAADGLEIDWRAVEHDFSGLGPLLLDVRRVVTMLLPGEGLPYALAGFVPHTGAAVAAYAAACRTGLAGAVRHLLFDALWLRGLDLGDPCVVHTVVVDAIRSSATGTDPLTLWEYGAGAAHQVGASTQRLLDVWAEEWSEAGNRTVPTLVIGRDRLHGVEAVEWLGAELVRRGVLQSVHAQPAEDRAHLV
jgi:2-hydroxychromene-2-carboxylate isomerase